VKLRYGAAVVAGVVLSVGMAASSAYAGSSIPPGQAKKAFVGPLTQLATIHSTVPANGDQNPYGVAVVPTTLGNLVQGNVLVSNFNDVNNAQGAGTTIMQVSPDRKAATVFADMSTQPLAATCPGGGIGLTTALVALRSGWVIVGSLPTNNAALVPGVPGCLLVLDSTGTVQKVITESGINGPWDMTALDQGSDVKLFVTNVLNGGVASQDPSVIVNEGTVVRIDLDIEPNEIPAVTDSTEIGSGFGEHTDPNALIVGPTGVGLADNGALYVADSVGNRIAVINNAVKRHNSAGTGRTFSADDNLSTPLGLAVAPNGNVLTVNAGDGNLVETRPSGQIAVRLLDNSGMPPGAGALFGLAVNPSGPSVYYVDDASNANSLKILF
jgi:hypothetical protein